MRKYDQVLTAYYNRERIQRELNEFYIFTSFRRSHDIYENPMHTREYDIIDDDTVEYDKTDLNKDTAYSVNPPSPNHKASSGYDIHALSPVSSDSGTEDNKIDVSFKTATTATTVPTTPNSFSTPRSTRRKSVQHSLMDGLSRSSPSFSNITGVSYGSENSSISDLKIKKRQIERSFELKYSVFPKTVEVSESSPNISLENFPKV
jgi:hypothetical protein